MFLREERLAEGVWSGRIGEPRLRQRGSLHEADNPSNNSDEPCWSAPNVTEFHSGIYREDEILKDVGSFGNYIIDSNPWAVSRDKVFARQLNSLKGRITLTDHGVGPALGFISGPLSFPQSTINEIDANGGDGRFSRARDEQQQRIESGVFGAARAGIGVLLCIGGLLISVMGFKRGGDALGVAMERGGAASLGFLAWFPVALGGCWGVAGVLGYRVAQSAP